MMKIGTVSYHNALPLTHGLSPETLLHLTPRDLVPALDSGKVDIALMPSFAIIANGWHAYPEAGLIGCDGKIASVGFFVKDHLSSLSEIESIYWDEDSVTSIHLAKILLKRGFDRNMKSLKQVTHDAAHTADALFLIGDKALFFRESGYRYFDLGQMWKEFTGFGFQFAAWAAKRVLTEDELKLLIASKNAGLASRHEIIANLPQAKREILEKYYFENVVYDDTASIRKGFALYRDLVRKDDLLRIPAA